MVMISLSYRCASLRFLTGPTRSSTIQNRRMMISSVGMLSSCGYDTCFSTTYRTTGGGMCVYNTWFIFSRWAEPLGLATMVDKQTFPELRLPTRIGDGEGVSKSRLRGHNRVL